MNVQATIGQILVRVEQNIISIFNYFSKPYDCKTLLVKITDANRLPWNSLYNYKSIYRETQFKEKYPGLSICWIVNGSNFNFNLLSELKLATFITLVGKATLVALIKKKNNNAQNTNCALMRSVHTTIAFLL